MRLRLVLWKAERVEHKERERETVREIFWGGLEKNGKYLFSGLQGISKLKVYHLLKRLSGMI